jgi:hypothetical protein
MEFSVIWELREILGASPEVPQAARGRIARTRARTYLARDVAAKGFYRMLRLAFRAALPAIVAIAASGTMAAPVDSVALAPHRAVYDLKLLKSHGNRGIESVRGRILYDFSGSACDGYELKFRQVAEMNSGEGAAVLSDLRSTTWEDGSAKKFRFNSENLLNDKRTDAVNGRAERQAKAVAVSLSKPKDKSFTVPVGAVFPTEHMRRIIAAAREGKTIVELPVYDGSETGEKMYHTLTVIGQPIKPGEKPVDDVSAKTLDQLTRWPVNISYFEQKSAQQEQTGEQVPVYTIGFELYENGVSRALVLDYSDFTIAGQLTSLDMKKVKPCK